MDMKKTTDRNKLDCSRNDGFTLIELMMVISILGVLFAIAMPSYQSFIEKADAATAMADISVIIDGIVAYELDYGELPSSLSAAGVALNDPWGNPYQYVNIATVNGLGGLRKDRSLVPINSDYDLYSKGKDGRSQGPLTAQVSKDDIIRANNGAFVGMVEDF